MCPPVCEVDTTFRRSTQFGKMASPDGYASTPASFQPRSRLLLALRRPVSGIRDRVMTSSTIWREGCRAHDAQRVQSVFLPIPWRPSLSPLAQTRRGCVRWRTELSRPRCDYRCKRAYGYDGSTRHPTTATFLDAAIIHGCRFIYIGQCELRNDRHLLVLEPYRGRGKTDLVVRGCAALRGVDLRRFRWLLGEALAPAIRAGCRP